MENKRQPKVWHDVRDILRRSGLDYDGIEVVTPYQGAHHTIYQNGEIIGRYDHSCKKLYLEHYMVERHGCEAVLQKQRAPRARRR